MNIHFAPCAKTDHVRLHMFKRSRIKMRAMHESPLQIRAFFLFLTIIAVCAGPVHSQDRLLVPLVTSRHFQVMAYAGCEAGALLRKIDFNYSSSLDTFYAPRETDQLKLLSKTLDAIFTEASNVLDIHIFSYKGTIKIFATKEAMNQALSVVMGQRISESSYYFQENNTIWTSFEDLTLGLIGHEIAHAIISSYFVVPPPPKVHEVLAGYVEYSLRKITGSLPE